MRKLEKSTMRFPLFNLGADKPISIKTPEAVACTACVFVPGEAPELDEEDVQELAEKWIKAHISGPFLEIISHWPVMEIRHVENDQVGRDIYEKTKQYGYSTAEAWTVCEAPSVFIVSGQDPVIPRAPVRGPCSARGWPWLNCQARSWWTATAPSLGTPAAHSTSCT
jgi:hypothetical protein